MPSYIVLKICRSWKHNVQKATTGLVLRNLQSADNEIRSSATLSVGIVSYLRGVHVFFTRGNRPRGGKTSLNYGYLSLRYRFRAMYIRSLHPATPPILGNAHIHIHTHRTTRRRRKKVSQNLALHGYIILSYVPNVLSIPRNNSPPT